MVIFDGLRIVKVFVSEDAPGGTGCDLRAEENAESVLLNKLVS